MSETAIVKVRNLIVFAAPCDPTKYDAMVRSYYAHRKWQARMMFEQEYPENPVIRVIDLGIVEVEVSIRKYRELQAMRDLQPPA